jgi:Xaa-Pro aminopeptidase
MLTAEGCAARRARLWHNVPDDIETLIIADPAHLIYFANYVPSPFVFRTNEASAMLILRRDKATLISDSMMEPFNDAAHVDEVVAPTWYDGQHSAPHRRHLLASTVIECLNRYHSTHFGIELGSVPAGVVLALQASRPGLMIFDLDAVIRPLRRSKDADEITVLKRSMRAGEAGHAAALAQVKPGMTERDVYLIVQNAAQRELNQEVIVYGDFASGPRCEIEKGGSPTTRVIAKGDLLILDYSVIVDGYRGDFTNTFAVGGGPTEKQQQFFDACVAAIKAGEAQLKPGNSCKAVDEAVRASFKLLELDHLFTSHSGHGIGLGHPEPPYFVPASDGVLQLGDVVAIEPGLYLEGVGGMRYEHNYLITETGFERLSNHELRIAQ